MTDVKFIRGKRMKSGDTLPELRVKLIDDGDAFNLSNWDVTVSIIRSNADKANVDGAVVNVTSPTRGIVEYDWNNTDTDTPGTYLVEFVAKDGAGSELTFPNSRRATIYIQDRI